MPGTRRVSWDCYTFGWGQCSGEFTLKDRWQGKVDELVKSSGLKPSEFRA